MATVGVQNGTVNAKNRCCIDDDLPTGAQEFTTVTAGACPPPLAPPMHGSQGPLRGLSNYTVTSGLYIGL